MSQTLSRTAIAIPFTIKITGEKIAALLGVHAEHLRIEGARVAKLEAVDDRRRYRGGDADEYRDRADRITAFASLIDSAQTYELTVEDLCRLGLFRNPTTTMHGGGFDMF